MQQQWHVCSSRTEVAVHTGKIMDYLRLTIHPLGDDAGAEIGEIVHDLGGTLTEKKLLGMMHYEARFASTDEAEKAKQVLAQAEFVSNVGWVETT